jgi:hypothetical protein
VIRAVTETVTWIKVEKPVFDLAGVLLSSLGFAAICAAVALCLGSILGALLIARALRRERRGEAPPLSLDLGASSSR